MNDRIKISLLTALVILAVFWLFAPQRQTLSSTLFCAHGRIFIEFDHGGYIWGTTFLDSDGKPIQCTDQLPVSGHQQQII
jgi:hypothetical protein